MSTITTGKVVIYKPNFSVNPVDTLLDLPVLGAENTLYVIKDTGAIYLWNGSEFVTTTTPTSKTVYVDDTYGNDVTGKRGYLNLPFKTQSAAIAVVESGDTLFFRSGTYTWGTVIPDISNITIKSDGVISGGTNIINSVSTDVRQVNIISEDITTSLPLSAGINGSLYFDVKNFTIGHNFSILAGSTSTIKINNLVKTGTAGHLFFIFHNEEYTNIIVNKYYFYDVATINASRWGLVTIFNNNTDIDNKTGGTVVCSVNEYILYANLSGLLYISDTSTKIISDYNYIVTVNNIKQVGYNVATTDKYGLVYSNSINTNHSNNKYTLNLINVDIDYPLYHNYIGISGATITFNITNLKINYSSLLMTSSAGVATAILNSNIIYNVNKGTVYEVFGFNAAHTSSITLTNSTIVINGDFTTNTDVAPRFVLDATSKIVFKGRLNLGDKKFDLSNITGAGADNVYFDNCTIITTGTNCIDAGSAKNIKVMNTYSNKVASANITSLIEPIVVNAIIN